MTLEEYFRTQTMVAADGTVYPAIDHALRITLENDCVSFYIHPALVSGDTRNFVLRGNAVVPDPRITHND